MVVSKPARGHTYLDVVIGDRCMLTLSHLFPNMPPHKLRDKKSSTIVGDRDTFMQIKQPYLSETLLRGRFGKTRTCCFTSDAQVRLRIECSH